MAPSRRYQTSFSMNPTWANWVAASIGSGAPSPHRSPASMRVTAAIWRLANTAALGVPVVPDVKTTATSRSGSGGSGGGAHPPPAASSAPTSSSLATTRAGATWARQVSRSDADRWGFTPAVAAPSLAAPR